ncbi:unnamed protein product [Mucor hiemalis]
MEWPDGSQSDVLYAPTIPSNGLPPVLVEIQHDINYNFTDRLVGYSLHKISHGCRDRKFWSTVHECRTDFHLLPPEAQQALKGMLADKLNMVTLQQNEVLRLDDSVKPTRALLQQRSHGLYKADEKALQGWIHERAWPIILVCPDLELPHSIYQLILDPNPIPKWLVFGNGKTCSNIETKFKATQHLFAKQLKLYKIAKEHTEKEKAGEPVAAALLDVCNQTNKQFTKLKEVILAMPNGLLKKSVLSYAEDVCLYVEAVYTRERKFIEKDLSCTSPMPAPLNLPEAGLNLIREFDANSNSNSNYNYNDDILPELDIPKSDMDYVLQFKRSPKSINWKEFYEVGKRDGYFSGYNSPASLRRAYFRKKPLIMISEQHKQ